MATRRAFTFAVAVSVVLAGFAALALGTALSPSAQAAVPYATRPVGRVHVAAAVHPSSYAQGPLSAPGGPFLRDQSGRVVFLHGVNAVYKYAPYELYPDPGKPWDFSATDAAAIAKLGFDVVRLGITWAGLEPGTAGPNDPAICAPGTPTGSGQFSEAVAEAYLSRLAQTVELLGEHHIYTLIDMHQDLYGQVFGGEGAPPWAVCTDGLPVVHPPGRWSNTYSTPALDAAFGHFWRNDVVGDLQGEYDQAWSMVASYFNANPWVVGYDPINEPFSTSLLADGSHELDSAIECFYTGTADPGDGAGGVPLSCPAQDPAVGLIPTILNADPHHLIFYEPDIFGAGGVPNYVGPMDLPNLVFNFHAYCPFRDPVTGDPTNLQACGSVVVGAVARRAQERSTLGSAAQPPGPALFMSEFGATHNSALVGELVSGADQNLVGWTYWAWKDYGDPTGSSHEGLVDAQGQLLPVADELAETYAQAVAGTPLSMHDAADGTFSLSYVPDDRIQAPTVIFVPVAQHYPHGYCAQTNGAHIVSAPGATYVDVVNNRGDRTVTVSIRSGPCR